MKTTKIMSKAVCASALMLPLALPVAAQETQPPVTWSGSTTTQLGFVQSTPAVLYNDCLQTDTNYSFNVTANVNLEGQYTAGQSHLLCAIE